MKKTNPLRIVEIENLANKIRKKFKINDDSSFPILDVIERLYENGYLTIQYLEDDNSLFEFNTPAKYNPCENFIYVKESVLEELENNEYRSNFTLAHEFFHFLQCQILDFSFEDCEKCNSFEDPEWQANEFAGQLLIPTKYITEDCSIKMLADKFMVTEECAATRKLYYKKRLNRNK